MANSEDSLVHELMDDLRAAKPMAFVYKLHGGMHQPGLPDLIVAMERGAALVEAKWATDAEFEKPLLEVCAAKLSAKQAVNLRALGVIDSPLRARVLIGGALIGDDLPGGHGVFCCAFDVADITKIAEQGAMITMLDLVFYLMELRRRKIETILPTALLACVQMQIKARGETWMAGHLLIGTRYYAAEIGAANDKEKAFEEA